MEAAWKPPFSEMLGAGEMQKGFDEAIAAGADVAEVTTFALASGANPYEVLKSAFMAGADTRTVIRAALSGGVTTAVIARAALDAGLDMQVVAGILSEEAEREGLAYTPLPGVLSGNQPDSSLVLGVLVGSGSQAGQNVSTSVP